MSHRTCPECGYGLDPGERCDCKDNTALQTMKTFYEVVTTIYDGNRARVAGPMARQSPERPQDSSSEQAGCDVYHDWFDTMEDAEAFVEKQKGA